MVASAATYTQVQAADHLAQLVAGCAQLLGPGPSHLRPWLSASLPWLASYGWLRWATYESSPRSSYGEFLQVSPTPSLTLPAPRGTLWGALEPPTRRAHHGRRGTRRAATLLGTAPGRRWPKCLKSRATLGLTWPTVARRVVDPPPHPPAARRNGGAEVCGAPPVLLGPPPALHPEPTRQPGSSQGRSRP